MTSITKFLAATAISAMTLAGCSEGGSGEANAAEAPEANSSTNWVRSVSETPEGGYLMGNPDAEVKLIEFASLTCPACRNWHETAMQDLKGKYIASGDVSYELRTFVLNTPDYIATMVSRCTTPEAFFALSGAFFERQQQWLGQFQTISEADQQRIQSMGPAEGIVELGRLGGVADFVKARGIPASKFESCLTDEAEQAEVEEIRRSGVEDLGVAGTPTFFVNGDRMDGNTWEAVQQRLDAAL
ncbi:MAG: thioredoxin domain-containing protein [Pacificimonas sp.]